MICYLLFFVILFLRDQKYVNAYSIESLKYISKTWIKYNPFSTNAYINIFKALVFKCIIFLILIATHSIKDLRNIFMNVLFLCSTKSKLFSKYTTWIYVCV